jgi:hypothetical protein
MVYKFMQKNLGKYSIKEMAGLFGVTRGAYYQWAKKGVSERRRKYDEELIRLIRDIQKKHDACGAHEFAIVRVKHHAAACGYHGARARALPQSRAFLGAKSGPAAPGNNLVHLQAAGGTDMLVGINESALKLLGEQAPYGAFPTGARADEEDKAGMFLQKHTALYRNKRHTSINCPGCPGSITADRPVAV